MRISDWSSDVCSSDLRDEAGTDSVTTWFNETLYSGFRQSHEIKKVLFEGKSKYQKVRVFETGRFGRMLALDGVVQCTEGDEFVRSEEHTSELQALMRISYAVFCLKTKTNQHIDNSYKYHS